MKGDEQSLFRAQATRGAGKVVAPGRFFVRLVPEASGALPSLRLAASPPPAGERLPIAAARPGASGAGRCDRTPGSRSQLARPLPQALIVIGI